MNCTVKIKYRDDFDVISEAGFNFSTAIRERN